MVLHASTTYSHYFECEEGNYSDDNNNAKYLDDNGVPICYSISQKNNIQK